MIVFSEADLDDGDGDADLGGLSRAALALGLQVVRVEAEAAAGPTLTGTLTSQAGAPWGIRFGTIVSAAHYRSFFEQAQRLGVNLVNSPEQHRDALEFDRTVHLLKGLTPDTRVVTSVEEVGPAIEALGLPLFIKGSVASRKWYGWKSCVATTRAEAEQLTAQLLKLTFFTRHRVLLRRVAPLRRTGAEYEGFPLSREYRLFALRGEVLARGYYWPFGDPFGEPTPADDAAITALVTETARRLGTPWLAVDVGQCDDGTWLVVETGDPQCSGLGHIGPAPLVEALAARLRSGGAR